MFDHDLQIREIHDDIVQSEHIRILGRSQYGWTRLRGVMELHHDSAILGFFVKRVNVPVIGKILAIRRRQQNPFEAVFFDRFFEIVEGRFVETIGRIEGLQAGQSDEKIRILPDDFQHVILAECGPPYSGHILPHGDCPGNPSLFEPADQILDRRIFRNRQLEPPVRLSIKVLFPDQMHVCINDHDCASLQALLGKCLPVPGLPIISPFWPIEPTLCPAKRA